jgi:hypothetical protein
MTLELGKQPPTITEVPVVEKKIDIQHGGQHVEDFICDVNRIRTVCLPLSSINQHATLGAGSLTHAPHPS